MQLRIAKEIAAQLQAELQPFCERISIVGSVRRNKPEPRDIELLFIPKKVIVGQLALFNAPVKMQSMQELVQIVDRYHKIKGDVLTGKYAQRLLPNGIKVDFFTAAKNSWGYQKLIRTGSSEFSRKVARRWVQLGFKGDDGYLTKDGSIIPVKEEEELFELLKLKYVEPAKRV